MRVALVRHGEADYGIVGNSGLFFRGMRRDFVPLSILGKKQAVEAGMRLREFIAERIVSSPYTRALETASIVAAQLGIPIYVEPQLHDWLPVCDGASVISDKIVQQKIAEFSGYLTQGREPVKRTWETLEEVRRRAVAVLNAHVDAGGLIAVAHELVIVALTGATNVPPGSIHYFDLISRTDLDKG